MSRWQRYWFAEGGRLAVAVLRIAIALAVLMSLRRLWNLPELVAARGLYRPVGLWMVLGRTPPPELLVGALWVLAWAGTLAMLLGVRARIATAISFGASVALASLSFSGSATWSHQYNVVFLAQLALLGARCGDALSVDAWLRRRRGLPPLDVPRGYQWSVRLVQLAVALMFVGAFFHKLAHARFTLDWALSDNLRHHLLVRYDLAGLARPALVDWLLEDVWRYRTAAMLNLISQLSPLAAILCVRRPLIRAAAGAMFVIEVMALGLVVSLWNLHWLPLAAVFVDWDRLIGWLARRAGRPLAEPPVPASDLEGWRAPRRARAFVIAFVVYDIATAFIPVIDQKLNTYPFSGFPMFATLRVTRPAGEHLPYAVAGDHFEVIGDRPLDAAGQRWLDHHHRNLHVVTDPRKLQARLAAVLARVQRRYPDHGIRGIRHYLALFEAPAYPAPAQFEMHPIAVTGELSADGTFRTLLGRIGPGDPSGKDTLVTKPQGLDPAGATLLYYADDRPISQPLAAELRGAIFTFDRVAADPVYFVARLGDTPWLVASKRSWKWQ
ncbi:MAG: hypothetical protein ACTHU0_17850 [Kofleriaceae bacterium]